MTTTSITQKQTFSLSPTSLQEAMQFADIISKSGMVPKDYIGKPGNVLIAVQMGAAVGLQPMQAIQSIAVINGRPCMWGDSLIGIVRASPICEYVKESFDEETQTAICQAKRKNEDEIKQTFSVEDAKLAGLWGRQGPWKNYPKRMLQMRARAFALRDAFADLLNGINVAEEVQDIPEEKDVTPKQEQPKHETKTEALEARLKSMQENQDTPEEKQLAAKEIQELYDEIFASIDASENAKDLKDAIKGVEKLPENIKQMLRAEYDKKNQALMKKSKESKKVKPEPEQDLDYIEGDSVFGAKG